MPQYTENVLSYHDIVANSLSAIITAISSDQPKIAKKIIMFNIEQAYTLYMLSDGEERSHDDIFKTFKEMKLDDRSIDELTIIMFSYQAKVGIKPVQTHKIRAHTYESMRKG